MITVFGSINIDLVTRVGALPRPGETVQGSDYALYPGGKGANQALAARRAGAEVRLVGAVGRDDFAPRALVELEAAGVDLALVEKADTTTGMAMIAVDGAGQNIIMISPGANMRVRAAQLDSVVLGPGDTLLLQMEIPNAQTFAAARRARAAGGRVILSLAPFTPLERAACGDISILLLNETEAADLAVHHGCAGADHAGRARSLARELGLSVVATLGPDGAVASDGSAVLRVPALPVQPVDTTGAGDTFAGVLAASLDQGDDLEAALRRAAAAGSLACTRGGAQPSFPGRAEIDAALARG